MISSTPAFLLLLFSSFLLPLKPVGNPIPPEKLYRYVPANANLVVGMDFRLVGHRLLDELAKFEKRPFVANNPVALRVRRGA